MAGIATVLDLLRKAPNLYSTQTTTTAIHSYALFSASAAAVSFAAGSPFASRFLFGNAGIPVAYCDAGATWNEDYLSKIGTASQNIFRHESLEYTTKEYIIELKPLLSAFGLRSFVMTSLRSFLMFYLPLLEPRAKLEDEDDDFLPGPEEERHVDMVVPFQKSVNQILRETTVVTTRRILERVAVHYGSQRMAWKLIKDVPESAVRKAQRGMSSYAYFFNVSKTTCRGHFLGIAASWLVQVGIEIYRYFSSKVNTKEEIDEIEEVEKAKILRMKIFGATMRCGSSLAFASIGAGIGATIFRPSVGQWIGCAVGDLAGPIIVTLCLEKIDWERKG